MSTPTDILCCGIIVADHVCTPISHLPAAGELVLAERMLLTIGGCAANVAVDLAKMGVASTVVGRVGDDVFGRIVADLLREQGVDVSRLMVTPGADTSQTLIVNVAGQDRRFIHTLGANAAFTAADVPLDLVRRCRVFYLGGYRIMPNMVQEDLAPVLAAARQAGAVTVLDVAIPGPGDHLAQLERLLPHTDVFVPNNHEAELITGERDPVQQAALFHRMGAKTALITMGQDGVVLVGGTLRLRAAAFPVELVDGSGGGDAFSAGYICGLVQGIDTEGCLRLACALGASCVRAIGTTTGVFNRAECDAFLRGHNLKVERI